MWIAAYGSENVPLSIYNVPAWFSFVLVDIMVLQRCFRYSWFREGWEREEEEKAAGT